VLNFWHFSARLEAKGYRPLLSVGDMMTGLGASGPTVAIGFAFREAWAAKNETSVKSFLAAIKEAIAILDKEEEIWQEIRPRMNAEDDATFEALKNAFRKGVLRRPLIVERADVTRLYAVLAELGGRKLVGRAKNLSAGTFWLKGDISQPVELEKEAH
jgi:NitT/TauT family transport system substrate-binding protein